MSGTDPPEGGRHPGFRGGGMLEPFAPGDERTRQLARRGVEAREIKRAGKRATSEAVNVAVASVRAAHDRGELGPTARAAAIDLIGRVVVGEIPVRHATDTAVLIRVLVDIARLEDNQPTRTALIGHVSTADLLARLRHLQQERPRVPLDEGGDQAGGAATPPPEGRIPDSALESTYTENERHDHAGLPGVAFEDAAELPAAPGDA